MVGSAGVLRCIPAGHRGREGRRGQNHGDRRTGRRSSQVWPVVSSIVEVEGKSGLAALFGREPLRYDEVDAALERRPGRHGGRSGPGRSRPTTRCSSTSTTTACAASRTGSCRAARSTWWRPPRPASRTSSSSARSSSSSGRATADLIVLDAPAAGHAITFLQSARGLLDAVRVGPINTQARDVLEMLTDPERCQVVLVTLPEETPVNELVETAYHLEDRVGVGLGPGGRERAVPRASPASTPTPSPRPRRPASRCTPGEADALARRGRRSAGTAWRCSASRSARLADAAAAAAAAPAVPVHADLGPDRRRRARPRRRCARRASRALGRRCRHRRSTRARRREPRSSSAAARAASARRPPPRSLALEARAGPAGVRRRHHRPGQAAGRRPRARGAHQHARRRSTATGRASCGR